MRKKLLISGGTGLMKDLNSAFGNTFFDEWEGGKISSSKSVGRNTVTKFVMRGIPGEALSLVSFETDLLDDMIIRTLSFLSPQDLSNVMLSSKKYLNLARDNYIWEPRDERLVDCVSREEKLKIVNISDKERNSHYWFECTKLFHISSRFIYPPKVIRVPKAKGKICDDVKKVIEFHYPFTGKKQLMYIVAITESHIRIYDSNKRELKRDIDVNNLKEEKSGKNKYKEKLYNAMQFDYRYLLTFSEINYIHRIRVWDLRMMKCARILVPNSPKNQCDEQVRRPYQYYRIVKIGTFEKRLLTCSEDHFVGVWNVGSGKLEYFFFGPNENFIDFYVLSDDQKLLIAVQEMVSRSGSDRVTVTLRPKFPPTHHVQVYDISTRRFFSDLPVNSKNAITIFAELVGKTPQKVALVKDNNEKSPGIQIWNVAGTRIVEMRGHEGEVSEMTFSVRLDVLITSSKDCTVRIWNMKRYRCLKVLKYVKPLLRVFEMKNRMICSWSEEDWKIQIWDRKRGVCVVVLDPEIEQDKNFSNFLVNVIELPNGKLVSLDTTRKIKIWDWDIDNFFTNI